MWNTAQNCEILGSNPVNHNIHNNNNNNSNFFF